MKEFIEELPTVFNILKYNPHAVVDDTAVERLLNWIEHVNSTQHLELVDVVLPLLRSHEIWNNLVTLSFSLRVAGYVGELSAAEILHDAVKDVLTKATVSNLFTEATVQYGFYCSLTNLAKSIRWQPFLNEFCWSVLLSTFSQSLLYVRKASTKYLATFLLTSAPATGELLHLKTSIQNHSNLHQLLCFGEALKELFVQDQRVCLHILHECGYVAKVIESMKNYSNESKCDLLRVLITIFTMITRSDMHDGVDWEKLLNVNVNDVTRAFIKLTQSISGEDDCKTLYTSLCASVLNLSTNSRYFPKRWNTWVLHMIIRPVLPLATLAINDEMSSIHHENTFKRLSLKEWKRYFVRANSTLTEVLQLKIHWKDEELGLFQVMTKLCMNILLLSLNHHDVNYDYDVNYDRVDMKERLLSTVNDRKITRICCQYFKAWQLRGSSVLFNEEYASFIMTALAISLDATQIICSLLELLIDFIAASPSHLQLVVDVPGYSLHETLNMRLWDISWEVKDTVLTCFIEIAEGVDKGYESHVSFLNDHRFWCRVLPLLDDHESFVRAKTVQFIAHIYTTEHLWKVFCIENKYSKEKLWKRYEELFTDDKRLDDMFTRRSVLRSIILMSELKKLCIVGQVNASNVDSDDITECVLNIVRNAFSDFDWEVRKLNLELLSKFVKNLDIFSFEKHQSKDFAIQNASQTDHFNVLLTTFLKMLISQNIARLVNDAILLDGEITVNLQAIQFLKTLGEFSSENESDNGCSKLDIRDPKFTIHGDEYDCSCKKRISTKEQFGEYLASHTLNTAEQLVEMVSLIDFDALSSGVEGLDENIKSDPVSFIHDVIASTKQSENNLLDCY